MGVNDLLEKKTLTTIEEIKAYNEPYRMKILLTLLKLERPATGKEIADEMNETPAKVHYHIKKMEKAGILELVDTKEINGIVAKYYEPTAKEFNIENKYLDDSSRKVMSDETCKMVCGIFDMAKDNYINNVHKITEANNGKAEKDKETGKGQFSYSEIYLNAKEHEEIEKLIYDFAKKHDKKGNGTKKYNMLFTIMQQYEKDDK